MLADKLHSHCWSTDLLVYYGQDGGATAALEVFLVDGAREEGEEESGWEEEVAVYMVR